MESRFEDLAGPRGFGAAAVDAGLQYGIESLTSGERAARISNLMLRREQGGARWALADLEFRTGEGVEPAARRICQTIVYYENPSLGLPVVIIRGKSLAGGLLAGAGRLAGLQPVVLRPAELTGVSLQIESFQPRTAAEALGGGVLACLDETSVPVSELVIQTSQRRVVMSRAKQILEGAELAAMLDLAERLITALVERAAGCDDLEARSRAEARQTFASLGGPLRALTVERLSQQEIDEFVAQPVPRRAPQAIRGLAYGNGSVLLYVVALLLMFGGVAVGAWLRNDLPAWGLALLGLTSLIGLAVGIAAFVFRRRRKRLLSHGECVAARVADVRATSVQVNGRRCFRVRLEFDHDGYPPATVNAFESAIEKAFDLQTFGQPTRVLVDPAAPRRLLWIDGAAVW